MRSISLLPRSSSSSRIAAPSQPTSGCRWPFAAFPVIGLILYLFTGRGWKAFSQEKEVAQEVVSGDLRTTLEKRAYRRGKLRVSTQRERPQDGRAAHGCWPTIPAPSSLHNEVEILQDAD
ncbi:MAG: hypothetical protein R2854_19580 [Caldilineaceae bacterium]